MSVSDLKAAEVGSFLACVKPRRPNCVMTRDSRDFGAACETKPFNRSPLFTNNCSIRRNVRESNDRNAATRREFGGGAGGALYRVQRGGNA